MAFFTDRDAMLRFARSRHHRELMQLGNRRDKRNATGGYIRLYYAEPGGYSNGVWRAEANTMRHIPAFTPLSTEDSGPPVRAPMTAGTTAFRPRTRSDRRDLRRVSWPAQTTAAMTRYVRALRAQVRRGSRTSRSAGLFFLRDAGGEVVGADDACTATTSTPSSAAATSCSG